MLINTSITSQKNNLSYFQKLVLCRELKFALPQRISNVEVQASFEKVYWRLEPLIPEEKKELATTTFKIDCTQLH